MLCKRGLSRHAVSVCPSVRHVRTFCRNEQTYCRIRTKPEAAHLLCYIFFWLFVFGILIYFWIVISEHAELLA